jgi:hypothetical protein
MTVTTPVGWLHHGWEPPCLRRDKGVLSSGSSVQRAAAANGEPVTTHWPHSSTTNLMLDRFALCASYGIHRREEFDKRA